MKICRINHKIEHNKTALLDVWYNPDFRKLKSSVALNVTLIQNKENEYINTSNKDIYKKI